MRLEEHSAAARPGPSATGSTLCRLTPSLAVIEQQIPSQSLPDEVFDRMPRHCHVLGQLLSPSVRGEYSTRRGVTTYQKRRGDFSVLPFGSTTPMRLSRSATFSVVFIETSFLESLFAENEALFSSTDLQFTAGARDEASIRILALLGKEAREGAPTGRVYSDSLLNALCQRLAVINRFPHRVNSGGQQGALPGPPLRRVKEMIESHLHENLTLAQIARVVEYSPSHFQRVFRAATGQTVHQYVLESRLNKAQELLQQRRRTVIEIAAQCGFSSQSHMTDVFRARLGITPARFRREALGERRYAVATP
jgi:AraC family transcriptional regulator